MTGEQVFMFGLACAAAVGGWLLRELWDAVKAMRKDLSALEVKLGSEYVRYDRLHDAMRPIIEQLQRIEESLTHKADR